ncbi:aminotransferase class I/II-fold pyridoxal phosphate-dependent enzyme [Massilia sp. H6]|uniref:aminotransferase class I/II-fold pyridoxal phosphate-dependent enzyme n=1 Tax=Massilia sp. H6 TaxID=2970464 RepID=UPI002168A0A3|nr:aminotransferase class I/II-fold pyridoxal phosphate-dependent enzyme [Massilia sp. H6]UVW28886.1 aminotransferase class I/II-fold pyridoxal phosphate-dependent enzyme [Massilia sp. H6]
MRAHRPSLPIAPVLSRASFSGPQGRHAAARPPSVLDAGQVRMVTSGRVAIALALRQMGLQPGDEVLVPAYHSPSMVPPVLWCGATPVFYRVGADASVDLDDVAAKLGPATRALMVTNYFGFPQALQTIRAFCDARGLQLLEDCAHCFFGQYRGKPVGSWGDYAIASSMKFFPTYEGGALVSARHRLDAIVLQPGGLGFEAKAALATLENSFAHGRLPVVRALLRLPLGLKDMAWRALKARHNAGAGASIKTSLAPASSDSGFDFEPRWVDKRSAWFSRVIMKLASTRRICTLRRRHYLVLEDATRGLPGCRPLFPTLPEGVVPWQFPLLLDDPESIFERLHAAGVPLVRFAHARWPGVDAATCANGAMLAQRVIAFPCHQELNPDELAWMADQLQQALLAQAVAA